MPAAPEAVVSTVMRPARTAWLMPMAAGFVKTWLVRKREKEAAGSSTSLYLMVAMAERASSHWE